MRTPRVAWLSLLLAPPCLFGGAARAVDEPMLHVAAEGGYACFANERRYHGIFGAADVGYAFDGFWMLRGGYGLGQHVSKGESFGVHQVNLGVRYQLDVFEYVPWIELSPAVYFTSGDGGPDEVAFGARVGFGFEWLMDPHWSLGTGVHFHQMASESRFPAYFTAGARLGYRWTFGDPFAP